MDIYIKTKRAIQSYKTSRFYAEDLWKKNWVRNVKCGMAIDTKLACKLFVKWPVKVFFGVKYVKNPG